MPSLSEELSGSGNRVIKLPNWIFYVKTQAGNILVNSPPETLKFLLAHRIEVPKIILLSPDIPLGQHLGSTGFVRNGINYASVEFLLYMNFFVRGIRRTRIITVSDSQVDRLRRLLEETIVGPEAPADYHHHQWLQRECRAISTPPAQEKPPALSDMVQITSLESGGGDLGTVQIHLNEEQFVIIENGKSIATVPAVIQGTATTQQMAPPQPVQRQEITLQFLGGSDGFDPEGITTCFMAYFGTSSDHHATLFDTAAYLRMRLGNMGVSPRQISEVVVTHVHEDHFAGFPELILMGESRIRVITSQTIYGSILRVLSAILDVPEDEVAALFDFFPLEPGNPLQLDGKKFEAIYAIHSIPTLAVKVNGLYYSGDMRYDEDWFRELEGKGIISPARHKELVSFANGAKILVQDVGGGPTHTTLTPALLRSLSAKSKHLILTHTRTRKLPGDTGDLPAIVEFAGSGHVTSIGEISATALDGEKLETISACPLYARLKPADRIHLANQAVLVNWGPGQVVLREQDSSTTDTFIVHDGLVEIWEGGKRLHVLGRGTSVGERLALRARPRDIIITAHGPVSLLKLAPELFQPVVRSLGLNEAVARAEWLWTHPTFKDLPWATLLDLSLDFQPHTFQTGDCLFAFGEIGTDCFLLISGKVVLNDENLIPIGELSEPGEFFGGRSVLFRTPRNATACATEESEIWSLPARALHRLEMVYPNLLLHIRNVEASRRGRPPLISILGSASESD